MKLRRLSDRAGVSLIELMIALTAGGVVLAITYHALSHFEQRLGEQQGSMVQHQELRIGMRIVEDELRAAGSGATPAEAAILKAEEQEVEFWANLSRLATTLTSQVSATQQVLAVANGSGWRKGKRVVVCGTEQCAVSSLAQSGRSATLSLTSPLGLAFPAGSQVTVTNRVRYYLKRNGTGENRLMRQIDGGAHLLISDVSWFRLTYFDSAGQPTTDAAQVARVRVELAVGADQQVVTKDVGLRGRWQWARG